MQHGTVGGICEGDVAEGDRPRGAREWPRVRSLDNFRCLVQERKGSLGAGQLRLQGCRLLGHGFQRFIELRQIAHQHEERAQEEVAGLDLANPDQQYRTRPQSGG